jgi:hypothetical protein
MFENLSENHFAYLAGIIDGEGCIYIGSHSSNKESGARYFVTSVQVANTDERLIDWLKEKFGGLKSVYTKNQTPKVFRKQPYLWKVTGPSLTLLCKKMIPHSVIKRNQLEVMIEMRNTYDLHPSQREKVKPNGIQPLSKELQELRYSLMQKLRALRN